MNRAQQLFVQQAQISRLHVLADFDGTLTTMFVDGARVPSLISVLRDGNYLSTKYSTAAHELYNQYHTIEHDETISLAERKRLMHEWWTQGFQLLIDHRFKQQDLVTVVQSGKIELRPGTVGLLRLLQDYNIPLVIMSASGLGSEAIKLFLEDAEINFPNIFIISNQWVWDDDGFAIAIRQPIIHTLNKAETTVQGTPAWKVIRNRRDVILLGDNPHDVEMVAGFPYDRLLKIGLLNEPTAELQAVFGKTFDMVIEGDGSLQPVLELVGEIVKMNKTA